MISGGITYASHYQGGSMDDNLITVTATGIVHNDGSVSVFRGTEDDGTVVHFVVEHRYAEDLFWAITGGEEPVCAVPHWAVVRRTPATA